MNQQEPQAGHGMRLNLAAITIFVPRNAKPRIRAALADGGHGTSYQAGLVNLLNQLLKQQGREPLR